MLLLESAPHLPHVCSVPAGSRFVVPDFPEVTTAAASESHLLSQRPHGVIFPVQESHPRPLLCRKCTRGSGSGVPAPRVAQALAVSGISSLGSCDERSKAHSGGRESWCRVFGQVAPAGIAGCAESLICGDRCWAVI